MSNPYTDLEKAARSYLSAIDESRKQDRYDYGVDCLTSHDKLIDCAETFSPRIQQLEAELEQTKKDLDHMASMHHAQEMKYLKAQSKVNALVEANENLRKLVNALQKEITS